MPEFVLHPAPAAGHVGIERPVRDSDQARAPARLEEGAVGEGAAQHRLVEFRQLAGGREHVFNESDRGHMAATVFGGGTVNRYAAAVAEIPPHTFVLFPANLVNTVTPLIRHRPQHNRIIRAGELKCQP